VSLDQIHGHLARVRQLYDADASAELLELADDLWARYGDEPDASLGECWRWAMVTAAKAPSTRPRAVLWRVRAQSAFARAGCANGLALTMLPDFFRAAELGADEAEVALGVLEAMLATAGGDRSAPVAADLVRNVVYEKRGFLRTQLATDREGLEQAIDDYDQALALPGVDARRRFKIRAAQLSVRHLLGDQEAPRALEALVDELAASGVDAGDVARIAGDNLVRMLAGRRDLESYEVL
jgi:hypothetical protein